MKKSRPDPDPTLLLAAAKSDLEACRSLIKAVASTLDMRLPEITAQTAVAATARLVRAITQLGEPREAPRALGPADGLSGSSMPSFDDLDDEIDRANGTALAPSGARTTMAPSPGRGAGADTVDLLAREVGVSIHGLPMDRALQAILDRLLTIKNPGVDVSAEADNPQISRGDSLATAIEHNLKTSQHLGDELRRSREIIARIAGALQISAWDADGTELVERVQRYYSLKHHISRRTKELYKGNTTQQFAATELQLLLAKIMSNKELAKWLEGKPAGAVNEAVLEAGESPSTPEFRPFVHGDIVRLEQMFANNKGDDPLVTWLHDDLNGIVRSRAASEELVRLMNLIVLPIVARQRAASSSSPLGG